MPECPWNCHLRIRRSLITHRPVPCNHLPPLYSILHPIFRALRAFRGFVSSLLSEARP